MDAEIAGRKTGTFGHLNTFSTFFSHHISTMEGGLVLTDDDELFHLLRAIRNHAWTRECATQKSNSASSRAVVSCGTTRRL